MPKGTCELFSLGMEPDGLSLMMSCDRGDVYWSYTRMQRAWRAFKDGLITVTPEAVRNFLLSPTVSDILPNPDSIIFEYVDHSGVRFFSVMDPAYEPPK